MYDVFQLEVVPKHGTRGMFHKVGFLVSWLC